MSRGTTGDYVDLGRGADVEVWHMGQVIGGCRVKEVGHGLVRQGDCKPSAHARTIKELPRKREGRPEDRPDLRPRRVGGVGSEAQEPRNPVSTHPQMCPIPNGDRAARTTART